MKYQVTKTYPHSLGLSAAFRQWRSVPSHCAFIHGYALEFKLTFEAETLDDRNWVIGFGDLKQVKRYLEETFDHKTLVAADDPELDWFREAHNRNIIDLLVVDDVGCEKFAEMVYEEINHLLIKMKQNNSTMASGIRLVSVECREHAGNSALYGGW